MISPTAVQVLVTRFGEAFTQQDELGRIVLVTAKIEGRISYGRVTELSDAHPRDITLKLQELVRRGVLSSTGRLRNVMHYIVTTRISSEQSSEQSGSAAQGWAPQEEQMRAVLAFCEGDWRTLTEIAKALNRAESTVRTKYIAALLANSQLERRFPDQPQHPRQAYWRTSLTDDDQ